VGASVFTGGHLLRHNFKRPLARGKNVVGVSKEHSMLEIFNECCSRMYRATSAMKLYKVSYGTVEDDKDLDP
jgi:hypothetical protein